MAERRKRLGAAWAAIKGAATGIFVRIVQEQPGGGASPGHMGYLHALLHADGPMTPGALAAEVGVAPATVTGALTALEDAGLVRRDRDREDRRTVHVSITPAGRTVQQEWSDALMRHLEAAMAGLSDEELSTLASLLERIAPPVHGPPRRLMQALRHDPLAGRSKA